MDPTLVGVIVGSLLSLLGNLAVQVLVLYKEERQWTRQQEREEKNLVRQEEKEKTQDIRSVYHNCIHILSLLVRSASKTESVQPTDEKQWELYCEAQKWLTLVALHQRDTHGNRGVSEFHQQLHNFTYDTHSHRAESLYNQVIELAMNDPELFPDALIEVDDQTEREVTIQIDQAFRRTEFLAGIELPAEYTLKFRTEELTPEQRRKLWDIFFGTYKSVPRRFGGLPIPVYNRQKRLITERGGAWAARINPLSSDTKEIFRAWEVDYEKALEEAQRESEVPPGDL